MVSYGMTFAPGDELMDDIAHVIARRCSLSIQKDLSLVVHVQLGDAFQ